MKMTGKIISRVVSVLQMVAVATLGIVAISCSSLNFEDAAGDQMNAYTAFGTIDGAAKTITEDSGDKLYIVELGSQMNESEVAALSGRIFYNYTILGGRSNNEFNIRLNCIYPLHIEEIKVLSQMSEEERKALGEDPVSPVQATLSGGYVNVQVCYVQGLDTAKDFMHDVDLIFNDSESTEDTMSLLLRHKGDGTNAAQEECEGIYEWISFRLTDTIKDMYNREDDDSGAIHRLYVVFNWLWWDEKDGKVRPYEGSIDPIPYGSVYNESDTTTTLRTPLLQ